MQVTEHSGDTLKYLTLEPDDHNPETPYPMVILLHGFGSNMHDLASLCPSIDPRGYIYVCPNAPLPLEIGLGATGYAWLIPPEGSPEAFLSASDQMAAFYEEVLGRYQVHPGWAVLGGFSQGGVMTYRSGLTNPKRFRGLIALSAWIPDTDGLLAELPEQRDQHIFIAHGWADTMIPLTRAREARRFLESEGYVPHYREYQMGHQTSQEEVDDLAGWLRGVLPPSGPISPRVSKKQ